MERRMAGFVGLLLLASPLTAQAQFFYTTNADNTLTITGYTGPGGDVAIPTNIAGFPVTSIGNAAFIDNPNLISVTIPDSVTSIGDYAFDGCANLSGLTIPSSVASIGDLAFWRCPRLTNAAIPSSVTNIGMAPFAYSASLTAISVDTNNSFYSSLNGVLFDKDANALIQYPGGLVGSYALPASVTSIGQGAFCGCASLTGVTFPGGVTNIGGEAFRDCSSLAAITIPAGVSNIADVTFWGCGKLTNVTIPGGATSIGVEAFGWCVSLTSLTIPRSVTNIGAYAFMICTSLARLTIPASVTDIGCDAFEGCTNLTGIYFQGDAPDIDGWDDMFFGDNQATVYYLPGTAGWSSNFAGLPAFPLPQDVFTFRTNADNTLAITGYTWTNGDVTIPTNINGQNVTTIEDGAFLGSAVATVTIPDGITSIGDLAFYGSTNLTSITIPGSVTNIGPFAFYGCSSLASVMIPVSVSSIGDATFYECGNLTNATISCGVTSIGDLAFYGCGGLTQITIPAGVNYIGDEAFGDCADLTSVYFNGSAPAIGSSLCLSDPATVYYFFGASGWNSDFAGLPTIMQIPFTYTTNADNTLAIASYTGPGGEVTIPTNVNGLTVTSVGEAAFYGSSLIGVIIPGSVTNIGVSAFQCCSNIPSVTIPSGVTSIGDCAFFECSSLTNVTTSDGLTSIGGLAFANSGLITASIPRSVTNIGEFAFQGCHGLETIAVDPENVSYSSLDGVLFDKAQTTLIQYPCGKSGSYSIPGTVAWIENSALAECSLLSSVTIPGTVTNIGEYVLSRCNNLTNATLGEGLTSVAFGMFCGCASLASISIPDSVTNIEGNAFSGCSSLTSLTIPDSVTSIGEEAYMSCAKLMGVFFEGSAPSGGTSCLGRATVYYLPGTVGWGSSFGGSPAVLWNPLIQAGDGSFGVLNNQLGFNITGTTNIPIVVEACADLAHPVWIPLQSVSLTTGSFYFNDPQWTNYPNRYYRIRSP
jgi:hypothetical protein